MDHTCFSAEGRGKEKDTVLEELVIVEACPSSDSERVPCYCLRTLGTSVQDSLPFPVDTRQITRSDKYPLWGWDSLSFAQNPPLNSRCTKKPFQEENNAIRKRRLSHLDAQVLSFARRVSAICSSGACITPSVWAPSPVQHPGSPPSQEASTFPESSSFPLLPPVILLRGYGS